MTCNLSSKTIIVFGGSGLIGSALWSAIKAAGATCYHPPRNPVDITNEVQVKSYLHGVQRRHGRLDGVVNAAWPSDSIEHEYAFDKATFWAADTMAVHPRGGAIVNFGSIYGAVEPYVTMYKDTEIEPDYHYAAAKKNIHQKSVEYAKAFAAHQIRINVVAPGGIFNGHSERFVKQYSERTPMGRMATVDDIVPLVLFLLSDASSYITGQVIFVSGGFEL